MPWPSQLNICGIRSPYERTDGLLVGRSTTSRLLEYVLRGTGLLFKGNADTQPGMVIGLQKQRNCPFYRSFPLCTNHRILPTTFTKAMDTGWLRVAAEYGVLRTLCPTIPSTASLAPYMD